MTVLHEMTLQEGHHVLIFQASINEFFFAYLLILVGIEHAENSFHPFNRLQLVRLKAFVLSKDLKDVKLC